jgi:hypothetical protein
MPTSTATRTTPMGACARCGGYRLSGHLTTCDQTRSLLPRPQLASSVQARPTNENILALQRYVRVRLVEGSGDR